MCGRAYHTYTDEELADRAFNKRKIQLELPSNFNMCVGEQIPFIYLLDGERTLGSGVWSIVPPHAREFVPNFKYPTFNARAETIFQKPTFRDPILKRRCVIPLSGFIEWRYTSKTKKMPYAIVQPDLKVMLLAGIFELWMDRPSVSIVTTKANELMMDIHNKWKFEPSKEGRMPLPLSDEDVDQWLNPELNSQKTIKPILDRYSANNEIKLRAFQVSPQIGKTSNKGSGMLDPQNSEILSN